MVLEYDDRMQPIIDSERERLEARLRETGMELQAEREIAQLLATDLEGSWSELEAINSELSASNSQILAQQQTIAELTARNNNLKQENSSLREQLQVADRHLNAIQASKSWRLRNLMVGLFRGKR